MKKVVSYEKVHRDYIKSHGEYPFKGSTDYFNEEEIKLIKKFGYWFEGLCSGELPLITPQQKEFKNLYDKIYTVLKDYPPESTKWWKQLYKEQKVWVRYVRFLETERQKKSINNKKVNELFNEVKTSEIEHTPNSYVPTNGLIYYLNNIIGLDDIDREIIKENIDYWNSLFDKSTSELTEKERDMLKSLNDDVGPSEKVESVFHYFFRQVKSLNLKDVTHFRCNDDSWYSDEMYQQMRKMMYKNTKYNHRTPLK